MPRASVNGLEMYYEIHGEGQPLVLLHGALSATGTSFGTMLPGLARSRQVIAVEQQAHGHTADVDRPLSIEQMAEDTAALLGRLGVPRADLLGYSLGAGIAVQATLRHPGLVRKLVIACVTYDRAGFQPGLLDGIEALRPELLAGTPWQEEYARIAPNPDDWATLVEKVKHLDGSFEGWTADQIRSIEAPTMLVAGDSDIVRPEHAVEMFRLLGGGVEGDSAGLPRSRLAILPGTTHTTITTRGPWLVPMVQEFLDG
jgi:pimeloyl-ACP methyl ester carboxylesterase